VDLVVDDGDGPVAVVQGVVIDPAQQHQVGEAGHAAVEPADDVVGVAVDRWRMADHAALVAPVQGVPQAVGDEPELAPDVEGLAVGAEDDRDDPGVTRQPPDR
jgi:hypothetical protein